MTKEIGWLLEKGKGKKSAFLTVADGMFRWTPEPEKALRLARRADADMLSVIIDDAETINCHTWEHATVLEPIPARMVRIWGCEAAEGFKMTVLESEVKQICKLIWDNPAGYRTGIENGTEEAYYNFTKYLWVTYVDGKEARLAEIAEGES